MAAGVHHAHKEGILHRDLKPSNILLDGEGQPKVVDFGVAALLTGEPVRSAAGDTPPDQHPSVRTALTRTGQVAGTIAYSAPELFGASPVVTPAADVWSLGVIAYELLVGQLPYPNGPVGKHAEPPPRPRAIRSEIDPGLEQIVLTCLCPDPAPEICLRGATGHGSGSLAAAEETLAHLYPTGRTGIGHPSRNRCRCCPTVASKSRQPTCSSVS